MGCDAAKDHHRRLGNGFNPRTHMGCDATERARLCSVGVSIHAPTWGATDYGHDPVLRDKVSIHAPTWGATISRSSFAFSKRFNPRTHMGCDHICPAEMRGLARFQSTHPHGVRQDLLAKTREYIKFQSTHPHGVRRGTMPKALAEHRFQSTHPRGVRRYLE